MELLNSCAASHRDGFGGGQIFAGTLVCRDFAIGNRRAQRQQRNALADGADRFARFEEVIDDTTCVRILFQLGDATFAADDDQNVVIGTERRVDRHVDGEIVPPGTILPAVDQTLFGSDDLKALLDLRERALNGRHMFFLQNRLLR